MKDKLINLRYNPKSYVKTVFTLFLLLAGLICVFVGMASYLGVVSGENTIISDNKGISQVNAQSNSTNEYTTFTIDDNTPFNHPDEIESFNSDGVAKGNLKTPNASIRVVDDDSKIDGFEAGLLDSRHDWLIVDYKQDKPVKLRLHLNKELLYPYTMDGVGSQTSKATADFKIIDNVNAMSVNVWIDNKGKHVFKLNSDQSLRSRITTTWSRRIPGVDVENILSSEEWEYVPDGSFTRGSAIYSVLSENPDDVVIQYRSGEKDWSVVPEEPTSGSPYYTMKRSGIDNTVYVVSNADNTPEVRYKLDSDSGDKIDEASDGVMGIVDSLIDDIEGLSDIFG